MFSTVGVGRRGVRPRPVASIAAGSSTAARAGPPGCRARRDGRGCPGAPRTAGRSRVAAPPSGCRRVSSYVPFDPGTTLACGSRVARGGIDVDRCAGFVQPSGDLFERMLDHDGPPLAVVLVWLLAGQLTPPATGVGVQHAEHEPPRAKAGSVEAHRRALVAVPLAIIDTVEHRLPKQFMRSAYAALIASLVLTGLAEGDMGGLLRASIGMTGSLLVYLAIAMACPGDLGAGDVRLAGVIGWVLAWHGWTTMVAGALLGAAVGSILGLSAIVGRYAVRHTQIPAGPAMLLGAVTALLIAGQAPT
jgi:prepilin signal peptidase PulO-like enzyme (type II secretory pathway)